MQFRVSCLGFRVSSSGVRISGFDFRVWGPGYVSKIWLHWGSASSTVAVDYIVF